MKIKALSAAVAAGLLSTSALAVDFHGYMRAGFGFNVDGGDQTCYGHGGPNAHVVGRLADECDTYAELSLSQNVVERSNGEKFSVHTLVAYGTQESYTDGRGNSWQGVGDANDPWSGQRLSFREAYAKYTMESGTELWAGNRYYGRKDVHIGDFYYLNGSGYGLGLDNIGFVGGSNLALAVRATKWKSLTENGGETVNSDYTSTPQLDLRWNGINVGMGTLDLIGLVGIENLSDSEEATAEANGDTTSGTGVSLTAEWTIGMPGGFNKLVAQYSTAGYAWATYGMNNHLGDGYNLGTGGDTQKDRKTLRVINHGLVKLAKNVDMSYMAHYSDFEDNDGSTGSRMGFIARPRLLWNDTMSTSLEVGYYVQDDPWMNESTDLNKIAISQNWSPLQEKGGFWARPEIRIFAAQFGGDQKVEDHDMMVGAMVEAWW